MDIAWRIDARRLRLALAGALLACVPLAAADDTPERAAPLRIERLQDDLPAADAAEAWSAPDARYLPFGDGGLRTLAFREHGTWLRIAPASEETPDAVLVVDSMVSAPVQAALRLRFQELGDDGAKIVPMTSLRD